MKQRLLIMNGQRIVQDEKEGAWVNKAVGKANGLSPGIYNIYLAKAADKAAKHEGPIVHAENGNIYQQVGKNFVVHSPEDFDKVPDVGNVKSIGYDAQGRAVVTALTATLSRAKNFSR